MISMARPLLADPYWVRKASEGRVDEINTCIGCNQVQHCLYIITLHSDSAALIVHAALQLMCYLLHAVLRVHCEQVQRTHSGTVSSAQYQV